MKKKLIALMLCCTLAQAAAAQSISDDIQQLVLDYQKLAQMKSILKEMYKGYQIVSTGYNQVRDITQGNFSLHEAFLNGLLSVSPAVARYHRIAGIITAQAEIIKEYKDGYRIFKKDPHFSAAELSYLGSVYQNLAAASLKNLDALTMVITSGKLRMSDDERLKAIDRIADDMTDKRSFLRCFNTDTRLQAIQRAREQNDCRTLQELYGLKQ